MRSFKEIGTTYRFKLVGRPLVTSEKHLEACYIYVETSIREMPKARDLIKIDPVYQDLPSYTVIIMSKEEILAEKIRTILVRDKARDAYDLWFLLKNNTKIHNDWIKEKLNYYNLKFSKKEFSKEIKKLEKGWEKDLKHLIREVPNFDEVTKFIKNKFVEVKL